MDQVEKVLAHFGVRGMHWGVRRSRSSRAAAATLARPTATDAAEAHRIQGTIRRHGLSAASNQEIRLLNERIGLEVKYNMAFPPKRSLRSKLVSQGAKSAGKVLTQVGEEQAKSLLNARAKDLLDPPVVGKHIRL